MAAVLRLERFDYVESEAEPELHSAEELLDAYARGMISGREQADSEQIDALKSCLTSLRTQVEELNASQSENRKRDASSFGALVNALSDGVLPTLARARMESAILAAFLQLAENVSPFRIAIRCGADLEPFVKACAREANVEDLVVEPNGPTGTVEAELLGGVITWDEEAAVQQLRAIVREVLEEN